ncbi:MAG: Druantia anti-phage system protein DruA [Candidatus Tectomicrobia bacterium]
MNHDLSHRYCGRIFTVEEIDRIRDLISSNPQHHRAQLSRLVCDELAWLRPDGRRKDMSCRVAMLRMDRDSLITLPPPLKGNGNGRNRPRLTVASEPQEPLRASVGSLGELSLRPVDSPLDSALWNELIERYHYLGYKPLPGAQIRYLVFSDKHLLAALGFGAAAWKVAPRDQFIGWTAEQRERNLHLVVNNARFLILPWIRVRYLASRLLAKIAKQLPRDWQARYGFRPVLLETFVQSNRFRGTCYRAANWIYVGQTKGRGKLDRKKQRLLPVKDVYLYPLHRHFRQNLASFN